MASQYAIEHLPKAQRAGRALPIGDTAGAYYDAAIAPGADGFCASSIKNAGFPEHAHAGKSRLPG